MLSPTVSTDCKAVASVGGDSRAYRFCAVLAVILTEIRGEDGQSNVEFALVFAAFLCIVIALGALWRAVDGGLFVEHALQSASHHLASVDIGAWGDVLAY
jgi:hypothetical protein